MKKIYSTQEQIKLYLLKAKLADQGIDCFIKNENPPVAGEIPATIAWPELWVVDNNQETQAKKIIELELTRLTQTKAMWTCAQCGEILEGQFEVCWKCGGSIT